MTIVSVIVQARRNRFRLSLADAAVFALVGSGHGHGDRRLRGAEQRDLRPDGPMT